ncbi:unnamed protein product [Parajaminaea phylloscopi]
MASSGPRGRGPRGGGTAGARGARGASSSSSSIAASIRGPPSSLQQGSGGVTASSATTGPNTTTPASSSSSSSSSTNGTGAGPSRSSGRPATAAPSNTEGGYAGPNTGVIGITDKSGRIDPLTDPSDRCPNCKTDRFLNPRLKLLVSPCYHKLCTSCIDRIWSLGPAPCPECGNVCRKSQFGSQTFADLTVEREVDIRKRVARIFGAKGQEDFASLKDYNDFLEQAELLTANLIHRVDLEETNAQLARIEAEVAPSSGRNAGRGRDDPNAAPAVSGEALALADARLLSLRQERLARRRAQDLEDLRVRKEEEDEIVTALEDGLEEEDITAIQEKYKRRRVEIDQGRDRQELDDVRREEQLRRDAAEAALPASKRASSAAVASGAASGSRGPDTGARDWRPESLLLFGGPLATLTTGEELLGAEPTDPISTAPPPSDGWVPYDPWLHSWLGALPQDEKERYRAGGYDVADYWQRQMLVAVSSLGLATPS